MSLGLELEIPKFNILQSYKGPLDEMKNTENCVFTFSPYKRLTGEYKDELTRVYRIDSSDAKYFGANRNGEIEQSEIMSWLNGSIGIVDWICNERKTNNPSTQSNLNYCPQISNGSNFHNNGLKFDGNNDYMSVDDYLEIQLQNNPLSYYCNYYNNSSYSGYLFIKSETDNAFTIQYCLQTITTSCRVFVNGDMGRIITTSDHNQIGSNKTMVCWQGIGANEFKIKSSVNTGQNIVNGTLTNKPNFNIGGYSTSNFADANIKSLLIFKSDEYSNYNNFANAEI